MNYRDAIVCAILGTAASMQAAASPVGDCSKETVAVAGQRVFVRGRLQPTILSSDLLQLSVCDPRGVPLSADDQRSLESDYRLETVPIASLPSARLKQGALCPDINECHVEVYRRKSLKPLPHRQEFSNSGGLAFAAFLGHLGKAGHFEITAVALKSPSFGASRESTAVMAAASRDADFFEWTVPAAHAQTPNTADGKIDVGRAQGAQGAFFEWMREGGRRVARLCREGDARSAAYALGYTLHAVQDLAFHEGITNAEHSFLDYHESQRIGVDSSERYEEKFQLATTATAGVLERFRAVLPASCWHSILQLRDVSPLDFDEKRRVLGRTALDFGPTEYLKYRRLSELVGVEAALVPAAELFVRPRWLTPPRTTALEDILRALKLEAQ